MQKLSKRLRKVTREIWLTSVSTVPEPSIIEINKTMKRNQNFWYINVTNGTAKVGIYCRLRLLEDIVS